MKLEDAVTDLRNQVSSQSAKVREIRELLTAKSQEHGEAAATLQHQIESQAQEMDDLRGQIALRTKQHDEAEMEIARLATQLEQLQSVLQKLRSEVSEAEKLRPENKLLEERVTDLMAHLKRVSAELEDSLEANAKAQDRIRDVENQLHDHVIKIRDLRRQRGSIENIAVDRDGPSSEPNRRAA